MKSLQILSISTALAVSASALAAVPDGYYDSFEGKSGVALKQAVKDLVAEHTVIDYGDPDPDNPFYPVYVASWSVFTESDTREVDGKLCWWDMYSINNVLVSNGHPGLNIEHSVPNSWWGGKAGSYNAYCDLHHLNPSNGDANSQKSNWPLGEINGTPYYINTVITTGTPKSGQGGGASRVFEPHDAYKGDFARAYFYIFTIYDDINWKDDYNWMYEKANSLTLQPWAYELLLKWAAADPVSEKETKRNDAIYKYQNNRNPFIDCPQLADHIWGSKQNEPFHYDLYTPAPDDPEQYPGWDEKFKEMTVGQWVPVTSDNELSEDETYYLVSPTTMRAMTYTLINTGKAIDECKISPLLELTTYPDVLTAVPHDIATVRLEKEGDAWYVAVYDPDDSFVGYINVKSKNTAVLSTSKEETCKATISVDASANRTLIAYTLSDGTYTLQYNKGNPRFAGYTSTQNPVQLYRASDEVLKDPEEDEPGNGDSGVGATGIDETAPEIIYGIFDINGRKVSATSTDNLEKGLYIVVSNFGSKKIRK